MDIEANLDSTFGALAHQVRRAILARLAMGPASVNEIAEPFEMSLPAISKHLRVLEAAGLIERGRDAQFRPCQLRAEALQPVMDWAAQYRPIWEARFDQMDTVLENMKEGTKT